MDGSGRVTLRNRRFLKKLEMKVSQSIGILPGLQGIIKKADDPLTKPTTADNNQSIQEPFTGAQGSVDTASEASHIENSVRGETSNTLQGDSRASHVKGDFKTGDFKRL